jgi:hypothetical protein
MVAQNDLAFIKAYAKLKLSFGLVWEQRKFTAS